jgi:hypothetical protein
MFAAELNPLGLSGTGVQAAISISLTIVHRQTIPFRKWCGSDRKGTPATLLAPLCQPAESTVHEPIHD